MEDEFEEDDEVEKEEDILEDFSVFELVFDFFVPI